MPLNICQTACFVKDHARGPELICHQPLHTEGCCTTAAATAASARRSLAQLRNMDFPNDRPIGRARQRLIIVVEVWMVSASPNFRRRSSTSSTPMIVTVGVSVWWVHCAAGKPAKLLTALTAVLNSVICAALTFVTLTPVGSSALEMIVGSVGKPTAAPSAMLLKTEVQLFCAFAAHTR